MNTQSNLRKVVKKWNEKRDNARYEIDRTDDHIETKKTNKKPNERSRFDFRRGSGRRRRRGKPVSSFHFVFFLPKSKKIKFHFVHFFSGRMRGKKNAKWTVVRFFPHEFRFFFHFFSFFVHLIFFWIFFGNFRRRWSPRQRPPDDGRLRFLFFFLVVFFKVIKLS